MSKWNKHTPGSFASRCEAIYGPGDSQGGSQGIPHGHIGVFHDSTLHLYSGIEPSELSDFIDWAIATWSDHHGEQLEGELYGRTLYLD